MAERITEEKVATLEEEFRRAERDDAVNRERASQSDSTTVRRVMVSMTAPELAEKRSAYLEARAQLERQRREDADSATAGVVSANQRMADASEAAARASAEAARWAKWAAVFTAIAAIVTLAATVVQAVRK